MKINTFLKNFLFVNVYVSAFHKMKKLHFLLDIANKMIYNSNVAGNKVIYGGCSSVG